MPNLITLILLTLATGTISQPVSAESTEHESSPWAYSTDSNSPDASDVWLPLASFVLPGAGQWIRGDVGNGATYSAVGLAGMSYASNAIQDMPKSTTGDPADDIGAKNIALRKYMLGLQTYQASGGISLYHTFRSAVWQRQKFGEYSFLKRGDTPSEILLAPLRFEYLKRSDTWIPLAIGGLASFYLATHPGEGTHRVPLTKEDPWFASAFSYNAGTHEEAVFRGWAMPALRESGLSPGFANLAQATAFALAHIPSTPLPLPQFFLGLHLGNVTLKNHWSISESIFIHVWWDVFAFLGTYHIEKNKSGDASARGPQKTSPAPVPLLLPPVNIFF